jgi:hypothetical protein
MHEELDKYKLNYEDLKLGRILGSGGQATVYEADLSGQRVAVKKFNRVQDANVETVAKLNHRNVVRLL